MIIDRVSELIITRLSTSPTIFSICGAADLGKTFISKKVVQILEQQNFSVSHLTMDSYLISRTERHNKDLSGYNIESYNIKQAINDLRNFINSEEIEYSPYNHQLGQCEDYTLKISNKDVLIFEGLHTMHSNFRKFLNTTFFIYTDDNNLHDIRLEADKEKRNLSEKLSKRLSELEFKQYKIHVEPYKQEADYLLHLKTKWDYDLLPSSNYV